MQSKVTVLIVNFNSAIETIKYVNHLKKQKNVEISILIIDNCSSDDSYQKLVDFYGSNSSVKIILSEKNGGYAYGNNVGLKFLLANERENQLVIISNTDIEIPDELMISELINFYYQCENPAFISPVMYVNGQIAKNCSWKLPSIKWDFYHIVPFFKRYLYEEIYYDLDSNPELKLEVDCLPGSFFLGQLETFRKIAFFDEKTFLFGEERILAKKVKNLGKSNYLIKELKYYHLTSGIITREISKISRMRSFFRSKEIFHKYYQNTPWHLLSLLKLVHFLYINTKIIQMKYYFYFGRFQKNKTIEI